MSERIAVRFFPGKREGNKKRQRKIIRLLRMCIFLNLLLVVFQFIHIDKIHVDLFSLRNRFTEVSLQKEEVKGILKNHLADKPKSKPSLSAVHTPVNDTVLLPDKDTSVKTIAAGRVTGNSTPEGTAKEIIIHEAGNNVDSLYHKVEAGQTLFSIGKKYGVAVDTLMNYNNLKSYLIIAGTKLKIRKTQVKT